MLYTQPLAMPYTRRHRQSIGNGLYVVMSNEPKPTPLPLRPLTADYAQRRFLGSLQDSAATPTGRCRRERPGGRLISLGELGSKTLIFACFAP